MEYFRISQDKRCLHPPIITNIRDIIKRRPDAAAGKGEQVADANVAFIAPQPETDFPDILDAQVFLVSDRMKEVFRMYEPSLRFKMVCVLDNIRGDYANYHIPLFRRRTACPRKAWSCRIKARSGSWSSVRSGSAPDGFSGWPGLGRTRRLSGWMSWKAF